MFQSAEVVEDKKKSYTREVPYAEWDTYCGFSLMFSLPIFFLKSNTLYAIYIKHIIIAYK